MFVSTLSVKRAVLSALGFSLLVLGIFSTHPKAQAPSGVQGDNPTGVCTPAPADIVGWWTGDFTLNDQAGLNHGALIGSIDQLGMYDPGFVGTSSFRLTGGNGYNFGSGESFTMTTAFSVSAWVYAKPDPGLLDGTLISKEGEFALSLSLGNLLYSFGSETGSPANYQLQANTWTHVAMTYDAGSLTIFANGLPVAAAAVPATLEDAAPAANDFVLGARQGLVAPFNNGDIDDVQLYRRALTPAELEAMFLSGRGGWCTPALTVLTAAPASTTYGSGATATLTAQLTSDGAGVAGRTLAFSMFGTPAGTAVTDSDGNASLTVSVANKDAGTYANVISVTHLGDGSYASSFAAATLRVRYATPAIDLNVGTFTYDKQTHAATVSATGAFGETLTPVVTYNGSSTLPLDAGLYTVVATLEATDNYNAATSMAYLTIQKATVSISGEIGGAQTYDGNPHAIQSASATGVGGDVLPVTVTYNGSSTAPINAGSYAVVINFEGSQNYEPASLSLSPPFTIERKLASIWWSVPQPLVYGQTLGAAQLNATASAPGTFSYTPAAGTAPHAGNLPLKVTFTPADPTNYTGGSLTQTVAVSPALLKVKANDAAKPFGAPLPVFTASYAGLVNGDTPAALSGSLAFTTSATAQSGVGTYPIGVGGVSSNDYVISFATGVLSVQPAATSVAVTSSANPSGVNQPIVLTASVSAIAPGAGQPAGMVTFLDGATVLGAAAVRNGSGSIATILATGTHAITATYSGGANFAASSSASLNQTVNSSNASTTTLVTSSRNPSRSGQLVMLTVRVMSPAGPATGTVEFLDGGVVIGTATLSGSGQATLTTTALAVGSHAITVRYLGSPTLPPSLSATLVQVVNTNVVTKATTTALTAAPSAGSYGTLSAFSVIVTPPAASPAPTGDVLFTIDGVSSTAVALTTSGAHGVATLSTSALPRGRHLVTVTYLGNGTYAGSTATLIYTVN